MLCLCALSLGIVKDLLLTYLYSHNATGHVIKTKHGVGAHPGDVTCVRKWRSVELTSLTAENCVRKRSERGQQDSTGYQLKYLRVDHAVIPLGEKLALGDEHLASCIALRHLSVRAAMMNVGIWISALSAARPLDEDLGLQTGRDAPITANGFTIHRTSPVQQ